MLAQLCALLCCGCHRNDHVFKSLAQAPTPPFIIHSQVQLFVLGLTGQRQGVSQTVVFSRTQRMILLSSSFGSLAAACSTWPQDFWVLVVGWGSISASRGHLQPLVRTPFSRSFFFLAWNSLTSFSSVSSLLGPSRVPGPAFFVPFYFLLQCFGSNPGFSNCRTCALPLSVHLSLDHLLYSTVLTST